MLLHNQHQTKLNIHLKIFKTFSTILIFNAQSYTSLLNSKTKNQLKETYKIN